MTTRKATTMDIEALAKHAADDAMRYIEVGGPVRGHMEIAMRKLAAKVAADERERSAKWAHDLISNGVTVLSADEVANAIRNGSNPHD